VVDLDFSVEETRGSEEEWTDRRRETLERVTQMEMVADVLSARFYREGWIRPRLLL